MSLRSWVSNSDDEVALLSPSLLFVKERVGIVAASRLTRPVAKDTIVLLLLLMMFVIVAGCSGPYFHLVVAAALHWSIFDFCLLFGHVGRWHWRFFIY